MKVCAVTTWPPHKDGVALYSAELYTHLAKLVDLKIIANIPEEPSEYESPKLKEGTVLRCWKRGSFTYPLTIFRSTLKEGPNIVHLQHGWLLYGNFISSTLFLILLLFFRLSRKPCVVTMHMVIRKDAHLHDNALVNLLARMAVLFMSSFIIKISDKIIVHNCLMKKVFQREYALQEESKIVVIPHGVKNASGKPSISRRGKRTWILSLGFVRESKGIEHLVKAFEKFLEVYPDARLIIAGGRHAHDKTDHIGKYKHLLTSNLSKYVFFTDFIDEKSLDRLIWKSDMIVLLSLDRYYVEASGVLARIADYGKPIICSRVPKFETELKNRENCIMITPGDSEELAQAFISLTLNTHLRESIKKNLRRKFKDRHWDAVAKQHFILYRTI